MLTTNTLTEDVLEVATSDQISDVARLSASTDLGLSSAGLIRWAAKGSGDVTTYEDYRPLDDDDLGRCERAYFKAPAWLAERMLPLLEVFRAGVAVKTAEYASRRAKWAAEDAKTARAARVALLAKANEVRSGELTQIQWDILSRCLESSIHREAFEEDGNLGSLGFTPEDADELLGLVNALA